MSEEDKDNITINKEEETKSEENQSQGETSPADTQSSVTSSESQEETQPKVEEKNGHEVIHKKDDRLHIYIRQDKYKGELKSKNWVGRLYIDGKQKISSSGTPNLEEAIPILEKWFDDIHANKGKEEQVPQETAETTSKQPTAPVEQAIPSVEKKPEPDVITQSVAAPTESKEPTTTKTSFLDKLKNIKLRKSSSADSSLSPKVSVAGKSNLKNKLESFFKSKLGKSSVKGEEILGVELTNKQIVLSQITSNKANQWVLEKFFTHPIDLPDDTTVIDNAEKIGEELSLAIQKSKIVTSNAAIAIPVTSAIIRVVTAPLMKDEELQTAIGSNSLWENLVQLTDNLDDYSIFHQVINRNQKENTMDILFVASKLTDINSYTSIIKGSGLNPVIIDVKCFALKSAVDQINKISRKTDDENLTAVLEFGLDENYLMILYNNNPIITDVFLRGQDRKILLDSQDEEEKQGLVRRFATQLKQAIQDFETKYEKRIRNVKVVSNLENVEGYLAAFRKNLVNIGFALFDPLDGLKIPQQLEGQLNLKNKSHLTSVIGLAFRKLDVFGYYKFVTAVKNINLLPDRKDMFKQKKMKAISKYAFKGVTAAIVGIYIILFGLSFWNISSYNAKLVNYGQVLKTHGLKAEESKVVSKELKIISTSLKLSRSLKSNKDLSYRILAQIASSVPKRLRFEQVEYNGTNRVTIMGAASSDQDILNFIENLGKQKLIKQASLSSMKFSKGKSSGGAQMKGFRIFVKIKG